MFFHHLIVSRIRNCIYKVEFFLILLIRRVAYRDLIFQLVLLGYYCGPWKNEQLSVLF